MLLLQFPLKSIAFLQLKKQLFPSQCLRFFLEYPQVALQEKQTTPGGKTTRRRMNLPRCMVHRV